MITVIDAMNAKGQDWECSEVLRAEVRRLIDAREERERQYRREWDGLRGLLAAAEQRAEAAEAALATLLDHLPSDEVLSESWQGDMYWEDIFALAEIVPIYRAALTAPATQPDARAAKERAIVEKGRVWQTAEDRLRAEEERQGADDPDAYLALSNDAEDARDDLLCVLRALVAVGATKEEA